MSIDKAVDSTQLDSDLTSVANAIRTKGGTSAALAFPAGFVSAVQAIPSGGGGVDLSGIKQSPNLNNVGGLFTEIENGSGWGYIEYSCVSGTNPISFDFGHSVKGVLIYPKSVISPSGLDGTEKQMLSLSFWDDPDENGNQALLWSVSRSKVNAANGGNINTVLNRTSSTTLVNGVLSLIPAYPSNKNYHPLGFGIPYIICYWW